MDYYSPPSARPADPEPEADPPTTPLAVSRALDLLLMSGDYGSALLAAREIRLLTKSSQRCRRLLSDAVQPLVSCLAAEGELREAALLALLNLAVKDESNKVKIVEAGALEPIVSFLRSDSVELTEYATAILLTLSASTVNKPLLSSSGAIPLLVGILKNGSQQAKIDALMALYNLSTHSDNINIILKADPIPSIVDLLKSSKKSSRTAEKCTALVESFLKFEEGRDALTSEEGGLFEIVDVLENGSLQGREHATGALLTMCQSDRSKYRDLILREGVIPGLLELTVQGSPKCQRKAHTLLRLLRESPYQRSEHHPDTLENIVCNIMSKIHGEEQPEKAKKMLTEMVQVSMEQTLRHLQQRALVCTPAGDDLPLANNRTTKGVFKVGS
ncbi:hypothetical protein MLD38_033794 [Melastoma candidum]|uniref:Uncharacterized protein n=1 Tax=Melastoma candidum TaxID=119954 RepID=A0ACB9M8H1_9MYRT|nr:hypothetical protein MLD38_033794 [Melastoma candidum]